MSQSTSSQIDSQVTADEIQTNMVIQLNHPASVRTTHGCVLPLNSKIHRLEDESTINYFVDSPGTGRKQVVSAQQEVSQSNYSENPSLAQAYYLVESITAGRDEEEHDFVHVTARQLLNEQYSRSGLLISFTLSFFRLDRNTFEEVVLVGTAVQEIKVKLFKNQS